MLLIAVVWVFPLSGEAASNWAHIKAYLLSDYMHGTLKVVIGVAILSGIIGIGSAWIVSNYEFQGRRLIDALLILPLAMPAYILAMSYGSLLEFAGPIQTTIRDALDLSKGDYWFPAIRSTGGAIFVMSLASYPYIYMLARGAFASQPAEWYNTGRSVGYSESKLFFKVGIPAARPFLVVGLALVIMEASADIGTVQLFGVPTMATGIYRTWYYFDEPILAARLASILLIISGILLMLERFGRRKARFSTVSSDPVDRRPLIGGNKLWLLLFGIIPIVLGFFLPLFWTARLALFANHSVDLVKLLATIIDTLWIAAIGAILVVVVAFVFALSARFHKSFGHMQLAATLGYAMPGVVIAVALLFIQGFAREYFGLKLLMTGSILGLLYAYLIRFLSPAFGTIQSGYERIPAEFDMVSETFGKSKLQQVFSVHLPMLKRPMLIAVLLVVIDIFKELPATLILRPFDLRTLAMAVYEYAGDDRPSDAAPYALALAGISLLLVLILTKLQEK